MEAITLDALSRRLAREVWPGEYPTVVPRSAIDNGSTATSLVVQGSASEGRMSGAFSLASAYAYDGVGVWMPVANTAATAPEGEYGGRVSAYAAATGTFTLSPGFSTSPAIDPAVPPAVIFLYGIDPWEWVDAINEVARTLYLPRVFPLTMAVDGDMESSGASDWTALGTASVSKVASAENGVSPLLGRMLKVVAAAAGDGVSVNVLRAVPGDVLSLWAPLASVSGLTVTVSLAEGADTKGSASVTLGSGGGWAETRFQGSLSDEPSGVEVRITASAAGTFYVGGLAVHSIHQSRYPLPAAVKDGADLLAVQALPAGRGLGAQGGWQGWAERMVPWPGRAYRDYGAGASHWVELDSCPTSLWPLFLTCRVAQAGYSGPTATVSEALYAPLELLLEGAAAAVCDRLAQAQRNPDWARKAQVHRRQYMRMVSSWDLLPSPRGQAVRRVLAL